MKLLNIHDANLALYEYSKIGETGETVLLLHPGGFISSYVWNEFVQNFKENYRVIAVDFRGHGNSEKTKSGYNMSNLANDIHEVLNQLNIQSVHIIGNSLGAEVGLVFASTYSDKVHSLTLIDGGILNLVGPNGERDETKEELLEERLNRPYPEYSSKEEFIRFVQENWIDFRKIASEIPLYKLDNGKWTFQQPNEIATLILEAGCNLDMLSLYNHVSCPVLFLPAEKEPKLEQKLKVIEEIKSKLPFIKTKIIPGSQHIMMLEHCNELSFEIKQFFFDIKNSINSI
ncbi:alpha/beta hydrolase [Bacillus sp. RG28]|uniref:Alpha/beta hydrolase n=1 Tax=Gottfriedia endophytica TaxID=2820819 RepID=A0A940NX17_9BACI|nr:alpha/beta hydrolase [Gottfriedia endophytica]MBP0726553.1 alpha/beta hydrolase [Gottfriedia endophytica]